MKEEVKNLKLSSELSQLYGNVDGLSLQNLFYARNGYFPSCQMFTQDMKGGEQYFDAKKFYNYLIENTPEDENLEHLCYSVYSMTTNEERLGFCAILNKSNLYLRIEKSISESYILFDSNNVDALKDMICKLSEFYVSEQPEKNNLWKIVAKQSGYSLLKSKVKEVENFDVRKQYNDDFEREDTKIMNFIKSEDNGGLVILHGEKGTGKSTYIRHLININPDRKFVFVPSSIIPLLGDPSFGTFLQTLANHVVILEDCENAIRDRKESNSSAAVSLLLNMTDGLLEDDLGIKFICTFNEDVKNIDSALLRKGRLVSKYEFKPLSVDKTNVLLSELYMGENAVKSDKPMTLADIYNYEDDSYEKVRRSII